jgi:hypothetical protein
MRDAPCFWRDEEEVHEMSAHVQSAVGFVERRQRANHRRRATAVPRCEPTEDFSGIARGVGVGAMFWMLLAGLVRVFG